MAPRSAITDLSSDRSTGAQIAEILRRRILLQELAPGERLVEAKTAKEFQVSITPVRQAFSILASQGLLTVFPYRGTYVTIMTKEYAADIFDVRRLLEPMVAKMALPSMKPSDADALITLCQHSDHYNRTGDLITSVEYDIMFHEFFFERYGNTLMLEVWNLMKTRMTFFQCISRSNCQADVPLLESRHGDIIKAVREQDGEGLQNALLQHLNDTFARAMLPENSSITYQ